MSDSHMKMTRGWKLANSLWILLTLLPFGLFAYGSFFFIGIRTGKKNWIRAGFIYLIITMVSFYIITTMDSDHVLTEIFVWVVLAAWIVCVFHSFAVRQEYLNIIFKRKIEYEYGLNAANKREIKDVASIKRQRDKSEKETKVNENNTHIKLTPQVININKATEHEIAALPSIHVFLAQSIIQVRDEGVLFESVEQLANAVNIKVHVLKKATPYIAFTDNEVTELKKQLDLDSTEKTNRSGRLVDY